MKTFDSDKIQPFQLVEFGLNPSLWRFEAKTEDLFQIVHIYDSELRIQGAFEWINQAIEISALEWIL